MLIEGKDIHKDLEVDADVVVVGTGAGGATAARELSDAGYKVVMLEYGAYVRSEDFDQREEHMAERMEGVRGWLSSEDSSLFFTFCNVLGGTTVHYWADCEELPAHRLDLWHEQHGFSNQELDRWLPYYKRVGEYIHVNETPEHLTNRNNVLIREATQRMGIHGHQVLQARKDCVGSGYCMTGCTYNRKQSQLVTNVPHVLKQGGDIYTQCDVRQILVKNGRAVGVRAQVIDHPSRKPLGHTVTVRAKTVILAAGALNTPVILLRSGIANSSGRVGQNLYCNPGVATYGLMQEDVEMFRGVPNAYTIDHYLQSRYTDESKNRLGYGHGERGYLEGGYIMLCSSTHPGYTGALSPGLGNETGAFMRDYRRLISQYSVIDDENPGSVRLDNKGNAIYTYSSNGVDLLKIRDFMLKSAAILLEAGANEVILPLNQAIRLRSPAEIAKLATWRVRPNDLAIAGPHPMGTAAMGSDPKTSVTGLNGETHDVKNLFICDSSVFPTSLGVDPSWTIMSRAAMTTDHIRDTRRPGN
jgi:choline dehydrogenase-like flavoprotein